MSCHPRCHQEKRVSNCGHSQISCHLCLYIIIIITDYCRVHLRVRMVVFVQSVVKKSRVPGKDRYVHAGEFG